MGRRRSATRIPRSSRSSPRRSGSSSTTSRSWGSCRRSPDATRRRRTCCAGGSVTPTAAGSCGGSSGACARARLRARHRRGGLRGRRVVRVVRVLQGARGGVRGTDRTFGVPQGAPVPGVHGGADHPRPRHVPAAHARRGVPARGCARARVPTSCAGRDAQVEVVEEDRVVDALLGWSRRVRPRGRAGSAAAAARRLVVADRVHRTAAADRTGRGCAAGGGRWAVRLGLAGVAELGGRVGRVLAMRPFVSVTELRGTASASGVTLRSRSSDAGGARRWRASGSRAARGTVVRCGSSSRRPGRCAEPSTGSRGAVSAWASGRAGGAAQQATLSLELPDPPPALPPESAAARVRGELLTTGVDLSAHVVGFYAPLLRELGSSTRQRSVTSRLGTRVRVAGVRVALQSPPQRSGRAGALPHPRRPHRSGPGHLLLPGARRLRLGRARGGARARRGGGLASRSVVARRSSAGGRGTSPGCGAHGRMGRSRGAA
jgi:hypothetical protein